MDQQLHFYTAHTNKIRNVILWQKLDMLMRLAVFASSVPKDNYRIQAACVTSRLKIKEHQELLVCNKEDNSARKKKMLQAVTRFKK